MKDFFKAYSGGIIFGVGIILTLGVYFQVFAVAPGAETNPTFNPSMDDVNLNLQLNCVTAQAGSNATCPAGFGYVVTGGGMTCGNDNDANDMYTTAIDNWYASCDGSSGHSSIAVCCKIQ